jgi:hypothetical protein
MLPGLNSMQPIARLCVAAKFDLFQLTMPANAQERTLLERQALDLRNKAEQFRSSAEGLRNLAARDALLKIAAEADRLAGTIEAQAKGLPGPSRARRIPAGLSVVPPVRCAGPRETDRFPHH